MMEDFHHAKMCNKLLKASNKDKIIKATRGKDTLGVEKQR